MKLIFMVVMFVALTLKGSLSYGAPVNHVGIVKSVIGEVVVVRNDQSIKAEPNMKLLVDDIVQTGVNGKAGLILEDDTVISLGLNSSIVIKDFIFKPNEKRLSFVARVLKGTVAYLSGQIAKLAPNCVRIETPNAIIGIRGTHVLIQVD
ncbi:MAG: FecR domain-containing protein [Pedobacter sp.]